MAIAFDTSTLTTSSTDVTSLSVSHTCTGSDLTLVAVVTIGGNAATCTGATYNSVAMTQQVVAGPDADNNKTYIFTLGNPATGAHTLSCSFSGNASPVALAGISLTGTNTSSPAGANNTSTPASATSFSLAVSTSFANSWIVDGCVTSSFGGGDTMNATGTNQTSRQSSSVSGFGNMGASTQTTTTTGSYTGTWNDGPNIAHNWAYARLEIRVLTAAVTSLLSRRLRMGIG